MKITNVIFLILLSIVLLLVSGCTQTVPDNKPGLATGLTLTPLTTATTATLSPATVPPLTPQGTCRQGLTWCNGHCSDLFADIGDCGACGNPCPSGQSCLNGQCCTRGLALCNGFCSDLTADVKNCGGCGNVCAAGSICHNSKCLNMNIVCPPGLTECYDEKCYNLTSDNLNCGYCGRICPAYSGCMNSACVAMEDENNPNYIINMPV